jgi:predicted Mrr-cat superfamily restriction endonuclease
VTAGGSNVAKAWVIRTGRYGERDQWALDNSVSGGGWHEYPDLTPYDTKEKIAKLVQATYPGEQGPGVVSFRQNMSGIAVGGGW